MRNPLSDLLPYRLQLDLRINRGDLEVDDEVDDEVEKGTLDRLRRAAPEYEPPTDDEILEETRRHRRRKGNAV